MYEKLVVVTRKTRLQELVERFNTRAQARFYIEHANGNFEEYVKEDDAYRRALDVLHSRVDVGLKTQWMDRELVPTYLFNEHDVVVTVGQDGLVANTAKYVGTQPIIAVNPDPERFDGILLPFVPEKVHHALMEVLTSKARVRRVTLAEASLNDGQKLVAFNDLFIGMRSHASARYRIRWQGGDEPQSSSGIVVSTGAGSTGWLSSIFNMVAGVSRTFGGEPAKSRRLEWEDPRLMFVVREPFQSRHSRAGIVAGLLEQEETLTIESNMPNGGVIFSDGVESDYLSFNSGFTATIQAAKRQATLVV